MNYHYYLWMLPFFFCLSGYYVVSWFVKVDYVVAPAVIGLELKEALQKLAAHNVHGHIAREREDPDVADGLVLDQIPYAGQKMKASQPMYITIAHQPAPQRAPELRGLRRGEIEQEAQRGGIRIKYYALEHIMPIDYCFAQFPACGDVLSDHTMYVYLSSGLTSLRIFPVCKHMAVEVVRAYFESLGMKVQIFHRESVVGDHVCDTCTVVDQKPLAGTLFSLVKPLMVQLIVSPVSVGG